MMLNQLGNRGSTVSSLISVPPHTASALSRSMMNMPTPPLSAAAIKISRDGRLLEGLMPKVGRSERMTLLSWFLEEEKLKQYEVFKSEFFEDPDEYSYALSSLLGTISWDPVGVPFVPSNLNRRNALYTSQVALTEKWKAIGAVFQHSWVNALDKTQREALIMRCFIDTANMDKEMIDARRQSFDLRTSELSGRGLISFIQDHCVQNNPNQTGNTQVSLPHTESMVRVFKDWVEKSGSSSEDDNNDALFRRSCALSLRDKCMYSRAFFATKLCMTVLEMWERIIRTVESKRGHTSKSNDVAVNCAPVATVTEVEAPPKQSKPKKKKKGKTGKKARRVPNSTQEVNNNPAINDREVESQTPPLDFDGFEDEIAVGSGTDESKSSGTSSPAGTGGDFFKFSTTTKELTTTQEGSIAKEEVAHVSTNIEPQIESTMATPNGHIQKQELSGVSFSNKLDEPQKVEEDEGLQIPEQQHSTTDLSNCAQELGKQTSELFLGSRCDHLIVMEINFISLDSPLVGTVSNPAIAQEWYPMEEVLQPEAEWLPVVGKKRKTDKHRPNLNNRQPGRKIIPDKEQPLSAPKIQGINQQQLRLIPALPQVSAAPVLNLPVPKPSLMVGIPDETKNASIVNDTNTGANVEFQAHIFKEQTTGAAESGVEIDLKDSCAKSNVQTSQTDASSEVQGLENSNTATYPAGSEASPSSTVNIKTKKTKAHRKRARSGSKEQVIDQAQEPLHSTTDGPPSSEPLNLENVTFYCAACHRPRGYHYSVQCPICGPESTIRYCSTSCRRQDSEHWRLCGLSPFPVPVIVPGSTVRHCSNTPQETWMTPAFARQRTLLAEQNNIDYFLFNSSTTNSPKHKLTFDDEKTKLQFLRLREKLFQRQEFKAVSLLFKILKSHCEQKGMNIASKDLAGQLFSEFGVNPLVHPVSKELQITPQDWIDAGI